MLKQVTTESARNRPDVRAGFVPLLHAAPLILAQAEGYFADEGLAVRLERQIGWGNVRDKLVYGQLEVSQALVGMPPSSVLGRDRFAEPVCAVMTVSTGGNGITVARRLADAGVTSAATLAERLRRQAAAGEPPAVFAHVFGCSTHHYLLREWLAAGGVDPDRDVRLCVLPPSQVAGQMAAGYLDGFCVGEPWNTAAERAGVGRVVAATADLLPGHPEKVLAANRGWLARHADAAVAVVRAVLRGCAFCHDRGNAGRVAEVLARPEYLDVDEQVVADALSRRGGTMPGRPTVGPTAPGFDPAGTFPSATHGAWLLSQMARWSHLPPGIDVADAARRAVHTDAYRRAVESLAGAGGPLGAIACPPDDCPPMRLRHGWYEARGAAAPAREVERPSVAAAIERAG